MSFAPLTLFLWIEQSTKLKLVYTFLFAILHKVLEKIVTFIFPVNTKLLYDTMFVGSINITNKK